MGPVVDALLPTVDGSRRSGSVLVVGADKTERFIDRVPPVDRDRVDCAVGGGCAGETADQFAALRPLELLLDRRQRKLISQKLRQRQRPWPERRRAECEGYAAERRAARWLFGRAREAIRMHGQPPP